MNDRGRNGILRNSLIISLGTGEETRGHGDVKKGEVVIIIIITLITRVPYLTIRSNVKLLFG